MGLFFQVLASGSKGNAVVVSSSKTRILVDAGLSARELKRRLDLTPVGSSQLDAVIVSHEHQDHVRGVGPLSRRHDLPVFLTQGTLEYLPSQTGLLAYVQIFRSGSPFRIGDLCIHPFSTCHDAHEPVGFVVEHEGSRLGICTDLGVATQLVRSKLRGCHSLILEANHDISLLLNGPYPPHLKQRIRSRHGHLSNDDTRELLRFLHHDHLQLVVLAHLSETNNRPDVVLESLRELRCDPEWRDTRFAVGKQHEVSASGQIESSRLGTSGIEESSEKM